jgi:hypothetical protein
MHLGQFVGMAVIIAGLVVLFFALNVHSRTPGWAGRFGAVWRMKEPVKAPTGQAIHLIHTHSTFQADDQLNGERGMTILRPELPH